MDNQPFAGTPVEKPPMDQRAPARPAIARSEQRKVNLALQGGGTHGAFTWGALERLLEDDRIDIEAVCGTSAGAMNAAMLVQGLARGGRAGAISLLERFWRAIAAGHTMSPFQNTPFERMLWGHDLTYSMAYNTLDALSRVISPYQANPFTLEINPLRQVVDQFLDAEFLRASPEAIRLFVTATNVRTGKARIFTREEISTEVMMASACLPNAFKAVEIDGEAYWDGGYMGNPALWPLYYERGAADIVLVQINPLRRDELPKTTADIMNRLAEISFNAALTAEMRAIDFVQRLLDAGRLEQPRYRRMFLHAIEDEDRMRRFKLSTKLNGSWDFLQTLRQYGREAAERFLTESYPMLGRDSTLDIQKYL